MYIYKELKDQMEERHCCGCCRCDCDHWRPRFSGCTLLCVHCTCVLCPPGCEDSLCCHEEQLMLDGDLKRLVAVRALVMDRETFHRLEEDRYSA